MIKRLKFWLAGIGVIAAALFSHFYFAGPAKETIIYFPLDESVSFKNAATTLLLKKENGPAVDWTAESRLDRKAYLRQDLALYFENGSLKGKMAKWIQNRADLVQEETIEGKDSAKIDAITFHYAEIHGAGDAITSAQDISGDLLYVIDSAFTPLHSFRVAKTREEQEWKRLLDENFANKLEMSLRKAERTYGINRVAYSAYPLKDIKKLASQPLPGFTQKQSAELIGKLWEGLYKNYYLGIQKSDGTAVDPIGSTMPIILISKDKTHLLVITETKDGESILLKQLL